MNTPSISSYNFEDSNQFGYNHRINIKMKSGDVYNIAVEQDLDKICLPKCIRKIFWAKVHLTDEDGNAKTFLVNKNSLAKRTGTNSSLVKFAHKKDKNFDSAMRILNKADRIAKTMEKDYVFQYKRLQKAEEIVKIFEKNQTKYTQKARTEGPFVKKKKGHTFLVRIDPNDPSKTNLYLKQSQLIGKGGYKTVHPLFDYEKAESNLAVSIQKENISPKGPDIMNKLAGSKHTMNAELYIENEKESYLVTKRYEGTFSNIISKTPSFPKKLKLFGLLLQGVKDMHAKGIVHRDLKNANVLFKEKNGETKIKIIDFDLSTSFEDAMASRTLSGTLHFLAPEVLSKKQISQPEKLDSWSIGIMLYQLCEGRLPDYFAELDSAPIESFASIIRQGLQDLEFKTLTNEDDPLRLTIEGLLSLNPEERLSIDDAYLAVTSYFADL